MPTPFGTLYSTNITPDPDTGIGKWTADQFYSLMHNGRSPDGGLIYPAMPFASYTKVTRADCDAIFGYLLSVPPVHAPNKPQDLRFPYNNRSLILGWRTLFFTEGSSSRTRPSPMTGIAGPIWSKDWGTARCATRRSMRSEAARNRRRSRAGLFRCRIGMRRH